MASKDDLRTPGVRPWRLKTTKPRNPTSALIFDADDRLVGAMAYGNAELIVRAVNAYKEEEGAE